MEPKYKPGEIVTHPLGFKCMVEAVYVSGTKENKAEDGTVTKEEVSFEHPLYELQYFTEIAGIQKTRLAEPFIVE